MSAEDNERTTVPVATVTFFNKKVPLRGILVVVGGILVHLTLGTQLTYGNTNPYLVSYVRKYSQPSDLRLVEGVWIQATMLMGAGVSMFLGGLLEHKLGLRLSCLVGSWILSFGVLSTYASLKMSYATAVLTYGVIFGVGCGIAYPMPVTCAMRWFPDQRGLIGGVIFAGFGCGAMLFNPVITHFLNSDNLSPDLTEGEDVYFTQAEVLDRVPTLFLVLGGTFAVMQLLGVLLMTDPPQGYCPDSVQETDHLKVTSSARANKKGEIGNSLLLIAEDEGCPDTSNPSSSSATATAAAFPSSPSSSLSSLSAVGLPSTTNSTASQSSAATPLEPPIASSSPSSPSHPSSSSPPPPASTSNSQPGQTTTTKTSTTSVKNEAMHWDSDIESFYSARQRIRKDMDCLQALENVLNVAIEKTESKQPTVTSNGSISHKKRKREEESKTNNVTVDNHVTVDMDVPPMKMLRSKQFYLIWSLFLFGGMGSVFMAAMYKILTSAASAFMGQMLKDILHFVGLFFLIGSMSCIGLVITFFVDARTPDGMAI